MIRTERGYVFDADGVLWDNTHRLPLIAHEPTDADWDAYYDPDNIAADPEIPGGVALARQLMRLGKLIIVTGRRRSAREATIRQLHKAQLSWPGREALVITRDNGDRRPNHEFKLEVARTLRPPWWDIPLWVDDNPKVATPLGTLGITVLVTRGVGQFQTEGT